MQVSGPSSATGSSSFLNFNKERFKCILWYLLANVVVVTLLFSIPTSQMWELKEGKSVLNLENFVTLIVLLILELISYFCLQGSDPGYLNEDLISKAVEQEGLLAVEDSMLDGLKEIARLTKNKRPGLCATEMVLLHETGANEALAEEPVSSNGPQRRNNRKSDGEEDNCNDEEKKESKTEEEPEDFDLDAAESQQLVSEGMRPLRCRYCKFIPPLRSHHCRHCNRCVATFDHHCFVIGTCIGEKNHCRFYWYLTFQTVVLAFVASMVATGFVESSDATDWFTANTFPLVTSIIVWVFLLFVFLQWCIQTFLAATRGTSYELYKGPEELDYLKHTREFDLPFSNGIVNNLEDFCCLRDGFWSVFGAAWKPQLWRPPGKIIRNSENVLDNLWENKYWSCC